MRYLLPLLLLLSAISHAEVGVDTRGREAEALFFAGNLDESAAAYKAILEEDISKEQKQAAGYNLATVYIEKGNWAEAERLLKEISEESDSSPAVRRHASANLAVLNLRRSLATLDRLEDGDAGALLQQAVGYLEQGIAAIDLAWEMERELAIRQGRSFDLEPEDLASTRRSLKNVLVAVVERKREHDLKTIAFDEGLALLLAEVGESIARLEQLGLRELDQPLLERHLLGYALEEQSLLPLWQRLSDHLQEQKESLDQEISTAEDESKKQELELKTQQILLLTEAENQHRIAMDWMREAELWKARAQQATAAVSLQLIARLSAGEDLLEGILEQRLILWEKKMLPGLPQALQSSLEQEDEKLLSFALMLADQDRKQLEARLDEPVEEAQLLEELQLRIKLTALLVEWLELRPEDSSKAYRQARMNLSLYRQTVKQEGDILLELHSRLDQAADIEQIALEMETLAQRFEIRASLINDSNRALLAQEAADILAAPARDAAAIQEQIEDALVRWDPMRFLMALIHELAGSYQKVLENPTPQLGDLQTLYPAHARLDRLASTVNQDELSSSLARSEGELQSAATYLRRGSEETGLLLIQEAQQELLYAELLLKNLVDLNAQAILQGGVNGQHHALRANQLLQQIEDSEGSEEQILRVLRHAQERTLKGVAKFHEGVPEGDSDWDEVVTLFDRGYEKASDARDKLLLNQPELEQALTQQTGAYRDWKEALELLKQPDQDGSEQEGEGQKDEGESEESEEEQSAREMTTQQVLQRLQEMDRDDETPQPEQRAVKQGLRPW